MNPGHSVLWHGSARLSHSAGSRKHRGQMWKMRSNSLCFTQKSNKYVVSKNCRYKNLFLLSQPITGTYTHVFICTHTSHLLDNDTYIRMSLCVCMYLYITIYDMIVIHTRVYMYIYITTDSSIYTYDILKTVESCFPAPQLCWKRHSKIRAPAMWHRKDFSR